jgi:hypothetical protein
MRLQGQRPGAKRLSIGNYPHGGDTRETAGFRNAYWGSSATASPRSSACAPEALAATTAPLARCSAAMPPAWSKRAWELLRQSAIQQDVPCV